MTAPFYRSKWECFSPRKTSTCSPYQLHRSNSRLTSPVTNSKNRIASCSHSGVVEPQLFSRLSLAARMIGRHVGGTVSIAQT
jgi:hypothetical protein